MENERRETDNQMINSRILLYGWIKVRLGIFFLKYSNSLVFSYDARCNILPKNTLYFFSCKTSISHSRSFWISFLSIWNSNNTNAKNKAKIQVRRRNFFKTPFIWYMADIYRESIYKNHKKELHYLSKYLAIDICNNTRSFI